MTLFKKLLSLCVVALVSSSSFAVNAPTGRQAQPAPSASPIPGVTMPTALPKAASVPAAVVTPEPGTGRSPRSPVSFDPSKFGSLTTSTLPIEKGDPLVGKVNGRAVTWDDFLITFEITAASLLRQYPGNRDGVMAALSAPVFDNLVLMELNREFAEKHRLDVNPAEAKRKAGEIIDQTVGPEKEALKGLTQAQLLTLATDTLVREKVEKFIGDRATSVPPTLDEITSVSATAAITLTTAPEETLRARHIVIRATPDMSEFNINDARAKAEEVLGKLREGMDFPVAARQYSQDRFTAYLGGNVGYFTRGSMFKEFEEAAFALKPGEISGVVRTPVGFHIIQVTERYPDNLRILIDDLRRFHAVDEWKRRAVMDAKVENFLLKGQ